MDGALLCLVSVAVLIGLMGVGFLVLAFVHFRRDRLLKNHGLLAGGRVTGTGREDIMNYPALVTKYSYDVPTHGGNTKTLDGQLFGRIGQLQDAHGNIRVRYLPRDAYIHQIEGSRTLALWAFVYSFIGLLLVVSSVALLVQMFGG